MKKSALDNTKQDNSKSGESQSPDPPLSSNYKWPALTFDVELFQHHLDDSTLTQEQKDEFLLDLWKCIVGFVDLGFDVHPLQQIETGECGQNLNLAEILTQKLPKLVECENDPKSNFNGLADERSGASAGRNQK